jgi:hypothetical protein
MVAKGGGGGGEEGELMAGVGLGLVGSTDCGDGWIEFHHTASLGVAKMINVLLIMYILPLLKINKNNLYNSSPAWHQGLS